MFRNAKLGVKALIPSIIAALLVTALLGFMVASQQRKLAEGQAQRTAAAITKQVMAERKVYTDRVVSKLKKDGVAIAPLDLKTYKTVQGGIPLPASFVHATSEEVNAKGLYTVDLLSLWPINPSKAPRNDWETQALNAVVTTQDKPVFNIRGDGDASEFMYVAPDIASADACVTCHNGHPGSPKRDFEVGDTMGAIVVKFPMAQDFALVRSNTISLVVMALGALALVTALVLLFQWIFVNKPTVEALKSLERAAERISTGELDEPVEVQSDDEIGRLGKAFERMRLSLKAAMDSIEQSSQR